MSRRVTVSATINGFDEEGFLGGENEYGHAQFTKETILGDAQPQNVMSMQCRWGGECRAELELTGQLMDDQSVRISGALVLFEGTSEDTTDEDGRKDFTFLVPKGKYVSNGQRADNTDEGGDWAEVKMTVVNALDEELPAEPPPTAFKAVSAQQRS